MLWEFQSTFYFWYVFFLTSQKFEVHSYEGSMSNMVTNTDKQLNIQKKVDPGNLGLQICFACVCVCVCWMDYADVDSKHWNLLQDFDLYIFLIQNTIIWIMSVAFDSFRYKRSPSQNSHKENNCVCAKIRTYCSYFISFYLSSPWVRIVVKVTFLLNYTGTRSVIWSFDLSGMWEAESRRQTLGLAVWVSAARNTEVVQSNIIHNLVLKCH